MIRDDIGFALIRSVILSVIGKLAPPSQPIRCKTKSNHDLVTRVFPRLKRMCLHVFTLSSHWLLVMLTFVLIGRCDYFGFRLTALSRNAL